MREGISTARIPYEHHAKPQELDPEIIAATGGVYTSRKELGKARFETIPGGGINPTGRGEKRAKTDVTVFTNGSEHTYFGEQSKLPEPQLRTVAEYDKKIETMVHKYFTEYPGTQMSDLRLKQAANKLNRKEAAALKLFEDIQVLRKEREKRFGEPHPTIQNRRNQISVAPVPVETMGEKEYTLEKLTGQPTKHSLQIKMPTEPAVEKISTQPAEQQKRQIEAQRKKDSVTQTRQLLTNVLTAREKIMDMKFGGFLFFGKKDMKDYFDPTIRQGLNEKQLDVFINGPDPLAGLRSKKMTLEEIGSKIKDNIDQARFKDYVVALDKYRFSLPNSTQAK